VCELMVKDNSRFSSIYCSAPFNNKRGGKCEDTCLRTVLDFHQLNAVSL
jgi:hypothetical protein